MWSIISNNCWGANLYQELGIEYNTPTIGLWFQADDYISLISDFRNIIKQPLRFTKASRHGFTPSYPIGLLAGKVEIQFMHYESEEEAERKWNSRVARLPVSDDDLYIKICDRDGFGQRHLEVFDKIPFVHKVGFFKRGKFDLSGYPWAIEVDSPHPTVEDGIKLWFQLKESAAFDVASWVSYKTKNLMAPKKIAVGSDLGPAFRAADKERRPFLIASALADTRDNYRGILSVAAMRSVDEDSFVKGLLIAIGVDKSNLPALRLLAWQHIRTGDFSAAKATLRSLIASWPNTPDNKRELARVNMLSPGPDSAEIFNLAAEEFRSRLGQFSYKCQHMIATSEPVTEPRANELKLFIDRAFAQIVRNSAEHDAALPQASALVFLDVIKTLLAAKTIALVANGPSLTDSKLGAEIDGHDVVVRCNFPLFSKFSEDVGSRVDIVFFNESLVNSVPSMLAKETAFKDCLSIAFHPDPGPLFSEGIYAQNMTSRVSRIQPRLREFYRDFFYSRPTTGLMGIIFISVVLGKALSIYGFDFYKQPKIHYYPSNAPIFLGHELQYEQWFLEKFLVWLDLGKITVRTKAVSEEEAS